MVGSACEIGLISHPSFVLHLSELLVSINDRLGGGEGRNMRPVSLAIVDDMVEIQQARVEAIEESRRDD